MSTFLDVIEGRARWSCECADALEWGASLPDDSIDLLNTSPPYLQARTYGREDVARDLDSWVAWMVEFVRVFAPKVKGLIAINCEGQTRNYKYLPAPFLLAADLHRAGFNLRKPPIFHRVGIPGSGGPDWLRNDTEAIICITRPGRLPWSDATAFGHPPKWAPGGDMSYRNAEGTRKNAVPKFGYEGGDLKPRASVKSSRELKQRGSYRQGGRAISVPVGDGRQEQQQYVPPKLVNPGNVIEETLTIGVFADILMAYAESTKADPCEVLRQLRQAVESQAEERWLVGVYSRVLSAEVLQPFLREQDAGINAIDGWQVPVVQQDDNEENAAVRGNGEPRGPDGAKVLRSAVHGKLCRAGGCEADLPCDCGAQQSEAQEEASRLRTVRGHKAARSASQGQRPDEQRARQPRSDVHPVPQGAPQGATENVQDLWSDALRSGVLQQALPAIQKVWRSVRERFLWESRDASSLISCLVGGGLMGHPLAHENEAPFPLGLPEFFVKSFAPPDGVICDPFDGSGTTCHAAFVNGRRFIGCDVRESQVQLVRRRMATVTPSMFSEVA